MLQRREFLQASLLAAWLTARGKRARRRGSTRTAPCSCWGPVWRACRPRHELRTRGFDVTVIEGRDRIGGRILTDRSLGVAIDLGCAHSFTA